MLAAVIPARTNVAAQSFPDPVFGLNVTVVIVLGEGNEIIHVSPEYVVPDTSNVLLPV